MCLIHLVLYRQAGRARRLPALPEMNFEIHTLIFLFIFLPYNIYYRNLYLLLFLSQYFLYYSGNFYYTLSSLIYLCYLFCMIISISLHLQICSSLAVCVYIHICLITFSYVLTTPIQIFTCPTPFIFPLCGCCVHLYSVPYLTQPSVYYSLYASEQLNIEFNWSIQSSS